MGVLHQGNWLDVRGGGHWLLVVGFDLDTAQYVVHDPAGEMRVRSGGYEPWTPTAGRFVRYSMEGLNARWMVEGSGNGWFLEVVK